MDQYPEAALSIAETGSRLAAAEAFDEIGSQGFIPAMGDIGRDEEEAGPISYIIC
jgi:hypothetical protein